MPMPVPGPGQILIATEAAGVAEQLATGAIKPEVVTLPLDQAAEAHRRLENREAEARSS
jgi:NADPH:quinone reductase